jgi:hypothetical protein
MKQTKTKSKKPVTIDARKSDKTLTKWANKHSLFLKANPAVESQVKSVLASIRSQIKSDESSY